MGIFNFLVKYAVRKFFLAFVICINGRFFLCVQLDPLFQNLCVQKENECVPGRNNALWIHLCLLSCKRFLLLWWKNKVTDHVSENTLWTTAGNIINSIGCHKRLTKCLSFKSCTILDVHSPGGKMSVLSLKSFNTQRAAHCLTLSFVSGETNSFGTSFPTASTISSLPIFAMHWSAKQTLMGLRLDKSFLIL